MVRPRRVRLVHLALLLAACGVILAATVWLSPAGDEVRSLAGRFNRDPGSHAVGEAQPWLSSQGDTPLRTVWRELSTSAALGGLGLLLLIRKAFRRGSPAPLAFVTWSVAMVAATLLQVRFSYYLTPAVALLAAWFFVRIFASGLHRVFAAVVIVVVALYPNLPRAVPAAANPAPGPSGAWLAALDWLRVNTPEPFGDPSAYLERWPRPGRGGSFRPPPGAWAVMAWWDHGYWISRVGRRIPIANPTQAGAPEAAAFFTAHDEAEAARKMERLGAKWVMVDRTVTLVEVAGARHMLGSLHAIVAWAGGDLDRFVPFYVVREDDGSRRVRPFYTPEYYRTLGVRLLAFGGAAVEPSPPFWVAELDAGRPPDPPSITAWRSFDSLRAAEAHVAASPQRRRLLSRDPYVSCVPVAGLDRFTRVHRSEGTIGEGARGAVPEVAVFAFH
jgi:dolichyl-diphosphooligosaccharide--protein glycosyltransferase